MTKQDNKSDEEKLREVQKTLEKRTERFLKVLERLDGVSREDDFKRIDD
jgi:hypothetical protein